MYEHDHITYNDVYNKNKTPTWSEFIVELNELKDDMLPTSSMDVEGSWSRGVSDIDMTGGGGGALAFFLRGVLPGRLGVLVVIEDLYIELETYN